MRTRDHATMPTPLLLRKLVGDGTRPVPLAVTPGLARTALAVVAGKMPALNLHVADSVAAAPAPAAAMLDTEPGQRPERKQFQVVDGIAILPVEGVLVNKTYSLHPWCGETGYDGLRGLTSMALADPDVRGILLDVESDGGQVDGLFEYVDFLHAARQEKPVWAACTARAYSAAYAIASQAERVWVPSVGGTGSVGVLCMHADESALWDAMGVTVTLVHAGAHKVDGNPFAALPDAIRADWEAEMEGIRRQFAERVARGRGLTVEAVLATEARCYEAAESIKIGFATNRGGIHDALRAFAAELDGGGQSIVVRDPTSSNEAQAMKTQQTGAVAASTHPRADKTQAPAADSPNAAPAEEDGDEEDEDEDEQDAPPAAPGTAAATAERQRIAAITRSPHAEGKSALADHLAFRTNMDAESAVAILMAAQPEAAPAQRGASVFAQAMSAGAPNAALGMGGAAEQPRTAGLRAAIQARVGTTAKA